MSDPITRTEQQADGSILITHPAFGWCEQAVVQSEAEVRLRVAQMHRALMKRKPER